MAPLITNWKAFEEAKLVVVMLSRSYLQDDRWQTRFVEKKSGFVFADTNDLFRATLTSRTDCHCVEVHV